jgi:hypothetical protein
MDAHKGSADAVRAAILARCWPDDLPRRGNVNLHLLSGETLEAARQRLGLRWNPQWLIDAGFEPWDAKGAWLNDGQPASAAGPMSWTPEPLLPRVDDQAPAVPKTSKATERLTEQRVTAGEVAVLAAWSRIASQHGLSTDDIDVGLTALGPNKAGQARGARFGAALAYFLELALPGWRIETGVNIRDVFGLHLRHDVVKRSADIVVIGPQGKIMAFVSSKFSWRSDRGTEAAQMVFLQRYRPDLPYVLVTSEFPRALGDVTNESIEDQAFHLGRDWVGAWQLTQELPDAGSSLTSLNELLTAGTDRVGDVLPGLDGLVGGLKSAARYL